MKKQLNETMQMYFIKYKDGDIGKLRKIPID